jgi:hypothetical protein
MTWVPLPIRDSLFVITLSLLEPGWEISIGLSYFLYALQKYELFGFSLGEMYLLGLDLKDPLLCMDLTDSLLKKGLSRSR